VNDRSDELQYFEYQIDYPKVPRLSVIVKKSIAASRVANIDFIRQSDSKFLLSNDCGNYYPNSLEKTLMHHYTDFFKKF
jgi:hypothetical protein